MYYLIINKKTHQYYLNKSKNPQRSIESHIQRANNPESKRYNTQLHTALREKGIDNFLFYKLTYVPEWIEKYKKYLN